MKKKVIFINILISVILTFHLLSLNISAEVTHLYGIGFFSYKIENCNSIITFYQMDSDINSLIIPSQIEGYPTVEIVEKAFFKQSIIKDITVPNSIQKIGSYAIGYEIGGISSDHISYKRIEDVVIRGYKGTAAETYALQNRFTFIAIDDEPETTTTPVTTDITTTETTVVTTQTTAVSNTATSSSVSTTSIAETTPITTTVTIPEIKGDANGDGKLSANDAAYIAKELAQSSISGEKITAEDYPSMDFNQDGKITAKDAADIARYLAEQSISDNKKV